MRLPLILLASSGILVLARTENKIINNGPVNGNQDQTGTSLHYTPTVALKGKRSLMALWKRDPEFEYAMSILARNAAEAQKNVDQIVDDIKHGKVDPQIVAASIERGLIKATPGFTGKKSKGVAKREAAAKIPVRTPSHPAHITEPKGTSHSPSRIAQHIRASGYIPPKIKAALIATKHYLVPGQSPEKPTKPPANKASTPKTGLVQGQGKSNSLRGPATGSLRGRDLDFGDLYVRAEGTVTLEDFVGLINAMESNRKTRKIVLKALNSEPKVQQMTEALIRKYAAGDKDKREDNSISLFAREPRVTFSGMKGLVDAMQDNSQAAKDVLASFNKDSSIAAVTEALFEKYAASDDKVARDLEDAEELWFEARDADAEAEVDDELLFETRDAEAESLFDDEL